MSSLLSTSRVVSSACIMVFIFHVPFLIPVTMSPTFSIFMMYSLCRLDRPEDKMQPHLTTFWIGNHSVVPWSTYNWHLTLCVGLVLTLPNAWLFPSFLCCGTPLCCQWFIYISYLVPCPTPFSESCFLHWHFIPYVKLRLFLNNSQQDLISMTK